MLYAVLPLTSDEAEAAAALSLRPRSFSIENKMGLEGEESDHASLRNVEGESWEEVGATSDEPVDITDSALPDSDDLTEEKSEDIADSESNAQSREQEEKKKTKVDENPEGEENEGESSYLVSLPKPESLRLVALSSLGFPVSAIAAQEQERKVSVLSP